MISLQFESTLLNRIKYRSVDKRQSMKFSLGDYCCNVYTVDPFCYSILVNITKLSKVVMIVHNEQYKHKPVGDWISAPNPNFVAMATRVGPTTFCMAPLNRPSPKTP